MRFTFEVINSGTLDLFEAIEKSLQSFGQTKLLQRRTKPGQGNPDGYLTINSGSRYACRVKSQINSQTLPVAMTQLHNLAEDSRLKPLLLTDYVNPAMAEVLKSNELAYIDRAGNTLLIDPPIFLWHRGFKPIEKSNRTTLAFQTTGLRLIAFLLITPDAINWPYRKLAEQADLSLGSISRIIGDLRNLGFVHLIGPDQNALTRVHKLIDQWEFGYLSRLRPSLKPQTFRMGETTPVEKLPKLLPPSLQDDVLIGGELAAAIATSHLRPQSVVLHVRPNRPLLPLLKALRLVPDPHGNVTILEQLGPTATWRWEGPKPAKLVHPLLVHAELLQGQTDDRLRETARLIYDQYLTMTDHDET